MNARAIAVWLILQLAVLSLSAARVRLWPGTPPAGERVALQQMLVAQVLLSALLFPWLMRNLASGMAVVVTSAPFAQLAAMLSEVALPRALAGWAYVVLWMLALLMWSLALRPPAPDRARLLAVALAGAWAIGVPVMRYLRMEFLHPAPPEQHSLLRFDPASAAVSQLQVDSRDALQWIVAATLLLAGAGGLLWSRLRARRQVIHSANPPTCG